MKTLSEEYGKHTDWHDPENELAKVTVQRDKLRKGLEWIADKLRIEGSADSTDAMQIVHHIEATIAKCEASNLNL